MENKTQGEKEGKTDNEIIAEFMGMKQNKGFWEDSKHAWLPHDLNKFQTSWDWLMPVVEKIYLIRTVEFKMSIGSLTIKCLLHGGFFGSGFCIPEKTDLQCWHMSVVEFIKWYNTQPNGSTINTKAND